MQLPGSLGRALRAPLRLPLRLRLLFRCAFVLLMAATLGLALAVLQDEKERSHRHYAEGLQKNLAQMAARLRHPTGQLMLLNAGAAERPATPLVPLVLPFGAIDFDDRAKAQQAVELAGCGVVYEGGASLCAAIGSNPFAGAFVYVVGQIPTGALQSHRSGELDVSTAHRVWVQVQARGQAERWIAPYQARGEAAAGSGAQQGRLAAFDGDASITSDSRPVRDFRGWMWQEGACLGPAPAASAASAATAASAAASPGGAHAAQAACARRTMISMRLPVAPWRAALEAGQPAWPPPDLADTQVRLQLLGPGEGQVLFDSDNPGRTGATAAFTLEEFRQLLLPGETLRVERAGEPRPVLQIKGRTDEAEPALPWIAQLIRRLPVPEPAGRSGEAPSPRLDQTQTQTLALALALRTDISTRLGTYQLVLQGNLRSVNQQLAAAATRMAWFVGAMLLAILGTWLLLEVVVMRRITLLTRRAAEVSVRMRAGGDEGLALDVKDLRGSDELGVLAQGLRDLLTRVNTDVQREHIRTRQEREQWHAVGHEIVSPLQSLMALHGGAEDPAARYIHRMQQAVRVLYGQASPSEAFTHSQLTLGALDLDAFVALVAGNAAYIGIDGVAYSAHGQPLWVRADEHSLEDVVTHVLRNAERHRLAGTPITMTLQARAEGALLSIHNQGAPIAPALLERIFDYGVSGEGGAEAGAGQRGQGLFVARTYMAKMGGTIVARNLADGVQFDLTLPRAEAAAA